VRYVALDPLWSWLAFAVQMRPSGMRIETANVVPRHPLVAINVGRKSA
jgi:hypothetical protein